MVGRHFAGRGIHALFCAGALSLELARAVEEFSPETEVFWFDTKEELRGRLREYKKSGDTILVKASHFMGFSEIVRALTEEEERGYFG